MSEGLEVQHKERRDRWATPILLGSMWVSVTVAGCGRTLDAANLEATIEEGIAKQGGSSLKSVICPTNVTPAEGHRFECIGVLESGSGFAIPVTQQDDRGSVLWDLPSVRGLLNLAKLQAEIERGLQKEVSQASVNCGSNPYRAVKPGETFECQIIKRDATSASSSKVKNRDSQKGDLRNADLKLESAEKTTSSPSSSTVAKPSEKIQITVQSSGDVDWQRIITLPSSTQVATGLASPTPPDATATKPGAVALPEADQSAPPPAIAPTSQPSGEDFLNQPGAADDFD
ncbi:DUF4333 domain-containing protein [Myxacorys almedinensis]|uniref:DUF4333 domain-containing protein n=1 Tax=Myxacorys almedinensis A TaxID=2690445 RepID=A0A8J7YZZ7_9CYAN|nr:DUF4333 domain-containing protein [Myxacorys almedinensis]NDJ16510.1 DUF4333 domain-containing protein [Myxacorys almedinensis A]